MERWRQTYDQWKLATPPHWEAPDCPDCGGDMQSEYDGLGGWHAYCPACRILGVPSVKEEANRDEDEEA